MSAGPRPTGITFDTPGRRVTVIWGDGHVSHYHWDGLRATCPCAACRGGHEFMGGPADPTPLRAPDRGEQTLRDVELVGSYALQCAWADGHSAGIYTWAYLRELCPCDECAEREAR